MVDEDPAHDLRGNCKEMGTVVPARAPLIDQVQEDFVNQRCGLQSMVRTFVAQLAAGDPAEFRVNERRKPIEGSLVAAAPLPQHLGHRSRPIPPRRIRH